MIAEFDTIVAIVGLLFALCLLIPLSVTVSNEVTRMNKKRKEGKSAFVNISSCSDTVQAEVAKAMKAIDDGTIANEKQVNHADEHDDNSEIERFKSYANCEYRTLSMDVIGTTVYGKY